jgi:hypothetical protein
MKKENALVFAIAFSVTQLAFLTYYFGRMAKALEILAGLK